MSLLFIEKSIPDLFLALQKASFLKDAKAIADLHFHASPEAILQAYHREKDAPDFELYDFFVRNFSLPTERHVEVQVMSDLRQHIHQLWTLLLRDPKKDTGHLSTLIPLHQPYVVPGGRFNEIYYWDSYFTMHGLLACGHSDIVENMIDNFAELIEAFGHIPNGNRTYFISRSQPPFFALMVELLASVKGEDILKKYRLAMEKEYAFWMDGANELANHTGTTSCHRRVVRLADGTLLNRYYDDLDEPRTEMYRDDVELYHRSPKPSLYRHIRAACESGWDFSSRWFKDPNSLASIRTLHIVPVDLNSLMFTLEQTLAKANLLAGHKEQSAHFARAAQERQEAIRRVFWSEERLFFCDYDIEAGVHSPILSLAGLYPLFAGIATPEQAEHTAHRTKQDFLKSGGLVSTTLTTGQQWDAPNGWSPLQWIAIDGLRKYGYTHLAEDIKKRWLHLVSKVFANTGKLMEKYNVVDIDLPAGGGEYDLQDGFGWTNGIAIKLMDEGLSSPHPTEASDVKL